MNLNSTPLSLRLSHEERCELKRIAYSLHWSEHRLVKDLIIAFLDQVQKADSTALQNMLLLISTASSLDPKTPS